jgi:hypothetical protein
MYIPPAPSTLTIGGLVTISDLTLSGSVRDLTGSTGTSGQVLSSTGSNTQWSTLTTGQSSGPSGAIQYSDGNGKFVGNDNFVYDGIGSIANSTNTNFITFDDGYGTVKVGTSAPDGNVYISATGISVNNDKISINLDAVNRGVVVGGYGGVSRIVVDNITNLNQNATVTFDSSDRIALTANTEILFNAPSISNIGTLTVTGESTLSGIAVGGGANISKIDASANANGYLQIGGILQQWGNEHIGSNPTTITFHKPFSGTPWYVTCANHSDSAKYANISGTATSTSFKMSGFIPHNGNPGYLTATLSAYWFAVGPA